MHPFIPAAVECAIYAKFRQMMASLVEFRRICDASDGVPPDSVILELLQAHHPLDVMCNWFDIRRRSQHLLIAERLCDLQTEGVARVGRSDSLQPYLQVYFIRRGLITANDSAWLQMFRRVAEMVGVHQHLNFAPGAQAYVDAMELMSLMTETDPTVSTKCMQQFGALAVPTTHSLELRLEI